MPITTVVPMTYISLTWAMTEESPAMGFMADTVNG